MFFVSRGLPWVKSREQEWGSDLLVRDKLSVLAHWEASHLISLGIWSPPLISTMFGTISCSSGIVLSLASQMTKTWIGIIYWILTWCWCFSLIENKQISPQPEQAQNPSTHYLSMHTYHWSTEFQMQASIGQLLSIEGWGSPTPSTEKFDNPSCFFERPECTGAVLNQELFSSHAGQHCISFGP